MPPAKIKCDSQGAEGPPCGADALVHLVHYVYSREQKPGQPAASHVLRETRYEIDCPRCGRRTQVEKSS
jgi:hypothetical protein